MRGGKLAHQFSHPARCLSTLVALFFALGGPARGDDAADLRTLFESNRWEEALALLQKNSPPPADSPESATYWYHLGTVHLRLNRLGPAVAYLEKAHALAPSQGDISQNLSVAQTGLARSIGQNKLDPTSNGIDLLADGIRIPEASAALALIGLALLAAGWRLKSPVSLGIGGLCIIAIPALAYWAQLRPAAIPFERVVVRSGPGEKFIEMSQIDAGTKIRLRGPTAADSGGRKWRQIRYGEDGQVGWVTESSLVPLGD